MYWTLRVPTDICFFPKELRCANGMPGINNNEEMTELMKEIRLLRSEITMLRRGTRRSGWHKSSEVGLHMSSSHGFPTAVWGTKHHFPYAHVGDSPCKSLSYRGRREREVAPPSSEPQLIGQVGSSLSSARYQPPWALVSLGWPFEKTRGKRCESAPRLTFG